MMDMTSRNAVSAAVSVAREHGLTCSTPEVLADGSNVLVHLPPAPVIARVATTTALVRRPIERWMALDLDIAGFLTAQGLPVVPPSAELLPGPHQWNGFTLTFWQYEQHDRSRAAATEEVGPLLREIHAALRSYPGKLERLSPVFEISEWLDEVETWNVFQDADIAMLRRGHKQIVDKIQALKLPEQPLHGDAHRKNLLRIDGRLLWTDFEDACSGPVEWDLACWIRTSLESREAALVSYGRNIGSEALGPFMEARDLQGAVWGAILSTRFPDRRERAAEWMELCRKRYG
jgi:hypothetical protein